MRRWFLLLMTIVLTSCMPSRADQESPVARQTPAMSTLPYYGQAPELTNQVWINTDQPLRLAGLRGKVILLEMWTYGCINCQHVIPSLTGWYRDFASQGLVIIGNHFPEFTSERDLGNLKNAVKRLAIPYPVAQDNEGTTWRAYSNEYWPSLYLIDKRGYIRYKHIGEGAYQDTEDAIKALLAE
jgi:thiol-disulfide isomerase/thioredoxin